MKQNPKTTLRLALLLCLILAVQALPSLAEESLSSLARSTKVVFLGENHASVSDHKGQLQALQVLADATDSPLIVAAEMFNATSVAELEVFANSADFSDFPEPFWKDQWGHSFDLYRDIFRWIKEQNHTLTYLRPDPADTKKVRENGALAAISQVEEFFLGPRAYRTHMAEIAAVHMPEGVEPSEEMVDSYFLIQCFWDEFMSWRLARLVQDNPHSLIVVLVGHGHLSRSFGIPQRLERRVPDLKTLTVGFSQEEDWAPDFVFQGPSKALEPASQHP